jgi:hypothetical protein
VHYILESSASLHLFISYLINKEYACGFRQLTRVYVQKTVDGPLDGLFRKNGPKTVKNSKRPSTINGLLDRRR